MGIPFFQGEAIICRNISRKFLLLMTGWTDATIAFFLCGNSNHPGICDPISKLVLSLFVWSNSKPYNFHVSNATVLGAILMLMGTWIRLMAFGLLGRFFRFEASIQKDHELLVSGPYAVIRHPSYTGAITIFIGWFL